MPDSSLSIHLARMTVGDVPRVHVLETQCFTLPWDLSSYYHEAVNPANCYLVAWLGTQIIGFGGMWVVEQEAHVVTLAVQPEYRRHGVGRLLMTALLEEAQRRGVIYFTLEVRASNTPAQTLYTSLGFRTIAYRRHYYPDNDEDAAVMALDMGNASYPA